MAALEQWPAEGVPAKPGAWLMATAKHRAIDRIRRSATFARKLEALGAEVTTAAWMPDPDAAFDDTVQDDVLRLVFMACHPVLSPEARVALTLRFVGGLTTAEIARAFLVPEATMAQRLVRAKKLLARERPPFELPSSEARQPRLTSVLEVLYLVFNEGYAASSGDALVRRSLCDEARRLARLLVEVAPRDAEAHGLAALMDLQASRLATRTDAAGDAVLPLDQDRTRWDTALIRAGLASLDAARRLASATGFYTLQAAIAACHARAARADGTDWASIVALYTALVAARGRDRASRQPRLGGAAPSRRRERDDVRCCRTAIVNRAAAFQHVPEVPRVELAGGLVHVFSGALDGVQSPADHFSPIVGADVQVHRGATLSTTWAPAGAE